MLAMVAAITSVLAHGAMVLSTMGTNNIVTPTCLHKRLLADILVVEVSDY
jgi:hypothetical protein